MRTHLLGEEEAVAEAVEGEWEGVEVHVVGLICYLVNHHLQSIKMCSCSSLHKLLFREWIPGVC